MIVTYKFMSLKCATIFLLGHSPTMNSNLPRLSQIALNSQLILICATQFFGNCNKKYFQVFPVC